VAVKDEKTIVVVRVEESAVPRSTVLRALLELGLVREVDRDCRWHAPGMLTVHAAGQVRPEALERLRAMPWARVLRTLEPGTRLVSSGSRSDFAVELPGGAAIGGDEPFVIAGPCSVESESQIREIAAAVAERGAHALRGGAFKPRTSPYSFGGLGERGLELLALAREETGLPVVTEALEPSHVDLVARFADVIQIGSRNMSNFPLLFQVGAHPSAKPVLLKRGLAATIEELLEAAEYVLLGRLFAGAERPGLILCERGIRTFETATRFTLDVAAIPTLKDRAFMPVIADPSHPAGRRELVRPLARAAVAVGADGLEVEVHQDPKTAWCDAAHSIDFETFGALMEDAARIALPGSLNR
jgi:3-deoxy-7-phosphoheptulonate synthase